MPHCAAVPRVLRPKFVRADYRTRNGHVKSIALSRRTVTVEGKQGGGGPGLRPSRRKTLNPVKTGLNIHERPVRKKKKTPKYETYERDRGVLPPPPEAPTTETNVLLALGLTPVSNGLNRMHVVDGEEEKPSSPAAGEPPAKNVAVSVATTTVEDIAPGGGEAAEADTKPPKPPASPKINGVCDSAGEGVLANSNFRRNSKEAPTEPDSKEERLSPTISNSRIKTEDDDAATVESSEPQDLTVTCTSSFDPPPKPFPSAKYISISVEQCQTTPPGGQQKKSKAIAGRKRSTKSSDSDECGYKRGRTDEREASVSAFIEQASGGGLEELQRHADGLQQEIHGLSALARTKELEWNDVIRMKKLKEEMYLKLIRRKQVMLMMMGAGSRPPDIDNSWDFAAENRMTDFITNDEVSLNRVKPRIPSNLTITKSQSGASQQLQRFLMQPHRQEMQQHLQQHGANGGNGRVKGSKSNRATPFPILPKPSQSNDALNSSVGRQGPIVDVKSIIADYRQSHPETIPRRGRRMKGSIAENLVSSSRGVLSMSSLALGSGSQVRTVGSTSGPEETSRPSSADSSRSEAMTFKDVYVQYAKMTNPPTAKAPPPYPEVTLHPVLPGSSQSPPPHTSLLHGILTKPGPAGGATGGPAGGAGGKATAFSPTLARLLTTPDRPSTTTTITTALRGAGTSTSNSPGPVSISELLSTSKTRNELTITPVVSNTQPAKVKEEVVSGSNEEDPDEQDRLVIDEGDEGERGEDAENDPPDAVPECQGCHLKPAQFVCAGCGNQWYCSRNCQVSAWDEHSDVCSG